MKSKLPSKSWIYLYENPTSSGISTVYISSHKAEDGGHFSSITTIIKPELNEQKTTQSYINDDEEKENKLNPLKKYDVIANTVFATSTHGYGFNSYQLSFHPNSPQVNPFQMVISKHSMKFEILRFVYLFFVDFICFVHIGKF